ncbi:helix-turn-helix domain-containing protein [Saccharothrix sp. Mg75]|uniref:helix-turn-helix domain-containing protein n=1 Tax=Saccharothrix sp. Mg75 TaxID=3445357 RepID=UPI003EEBA61D
MSNEVHDHPAGAHPDLAPVSVLPFRARPAGRGTFPVASPDLALWSGSATWRSLLDRVALLSTREREVLLLLGVGASNRTIANRLAVSERTVKAHVAQVMAKLVVESRLQAGLVSLVFQMTGDGVPPVSSSISGASPLRHGESA